MARPNHKPTPKNRGLVEAYVASGATQETIANLLRISVSTLAKHYRAELDAGLELANARIAGVLFGKACEGDTASVIFWLKSRAKWTEKHKVEVEGKMSVVDLIASLDPSEFDE